MKIAYPAGYDAERRYALQLVLEHILGVAHTAEPGADGEYVTITAPEHGGARRLRVLDRLFRTPRNEWLTAASLPATPPQWMAVPDFPDANPSCPRRIPVLYGPEARPAGIRMDDEEIVIDVDLLGGAFFMATRYEEAVVEAADRHGRFPAAAALPHREGFLQLPLVHVYGELLWACMHALWPGLQRRRRSYRLVLTHDVDEPFCVATRPPLRVLRQVGGDLAKRRDITLAASRMLSLAETWWGRRSRDPCLQAFDFIMDRSERANCRSAFYFMAESAASRRDGRYSLEDPAIRQLMGRIATRGHEVGLHPSYGTHLDARRIDEEFQRLMRTVDELGIRQDRWGGRQHYLCWRNPQTWRAWDEVGLDYDSSVGFSEQVGFRTGMCCEYPVFDLVARRELRLTERPLVAMDVTLWTYMGLTTEGALQQLRDLANACRPYGGELCVLVHNNYLVSTAGRRAYDGCLAAMS